MAFSRKTATARAISPISSRACVPAIGWSYFSVMTERIAAMISLSGRMMLRAISAPMTTMTVRKITATSATF